MPNARLDNAEKKAREQRAQEWLKFRKDNLITQIKFADLLGVSRRTIQMIERGRVSPYPITLRKYEALNAKYNQGTTAL